ncbi:aminoacyl-tRNA deacylase and HDOD domain-containing protein [Pseudomonas guariconensis]|uniref:aminoacyl-tRNA deacylase and HDOD domain-containing protein n=1 Tax=Pseudomonas TaxID=286 RepID=UPI001CE45492|nr:MULTISPECIES: aminoacyl-tRNA deacylase and HDOD domain-containing protein [Pseudomonas]MCO7639453.1 aminoacyl-tRNA deacylase and HDOD domain-containing protein [Pseudomonas sp. S 311-6]MCO7514675.1 aminoacyl-tRNA deacylase and HDOD domain-containing protein [Pseudomonas putida]MCO7564678.1 aminoacyl-tRNA deacylase and HDOD domain-containing protein [Pseudomonas mosselii]MCO7593348.1 aminoacyl-tRNA deacylase and HDOD domain-containing protein [Pseudomonas guariconensis]MCO7605484.1 aminoacyl
MTEVALDTATPHVPSVIRLLLEKLGVAYREVPEHLSLPATSRVQAILLEDEVGALMALFPQSQLLDLNRLTELTGRKLVAVPMARLKHMLDKHGLKALPGIPALTSSPCLYEESLLHADKLLIQSGESGLLLEIERDAFKRMLNKASVGSFGEAVKDIRPNLDRPADDPKEITQAVQAFTARRIQQRLEQTIEIPPLADTAQKIIKLRVDPNASIDDITGVVETDPALAAQVVSWAASPYYASPGKIRSVEDAIVRVLGFDLVINLALGLALGKAMSLPKDHPQQATPYWQQSIYTAAVIEGLTRAMPRAERPEAGLTYLAGLLHNFGYLLLAHVFPPHFSLICRHLEVNPHLNHTFVEQHLLGISREQIGAWLMKLWDMPEELSTALRFQHDPSYDGEYAAFPNLVCLATRLLRTRGIGSGPEAPIPDALLERLGLSREKAEESVDKVLAAETLLRELASQFNAPH